MKIENNIIDNLCAKNKYWYTHLGALLVFLVLCYHTMLLQTGHIGQGFKDHASKLPNINIHTSQYFHSLMRNHYIASLDKRTWYKKNFQGKKRRKVQTTIMGPEQRSPQTTAQIIT